MNYTDEQIKKTLALYSKSGLSIKEFCKLNNLTKYTFSLWRQRFPNVIIQQNRLSNNKDNSNIQNTFQNEFIEIKSTDSNVFKSKFNITFGDFNINFDNPISHKDFKVIIDILGITKKC